jgi:hypothetical protein
LQFGEFNRSAIRQIQVVLKIGKLQGVSAGLNLCKQFKRHFMIKALKSMARNAGLRRGEGEVFLQDVGWGLLALVGLVFAEDIVFAEQLPIILRLLGIALLATSYPLFRRFGRRAYPVASAIVSGEKMPDTPYRMATIAGACLLLLLGFIAANMGVMLAELSFGFKKGSGKPIPEWPGWNLEAATWVQGHIGMLIGFSCSMLCLVCFLILLYGLFVAALVLVLSLTRPVVVED